MKVPAFLLRRLYVKGSLRNENGGFAFDLKNSLGSGYAEQVLPVAIDGVEVPVSASRFIVEGEVRPFAAISAEQPMTLAMNRIVTIAVDGAPLAPGKHKIDIGFVVTGMGELRFDVTDAIPGGGDAA
jgi:hydroxymethylglutaryl-CoA reductase (NADPH)